MKETEVVAASKPKRSMKKCAVATRASCFTLWGMANAMGTSTVFEGLMGVLEEVKEAEGEGVPPGAERVVLGLLELEGEGRLLMDSLG